MTEPLRLKLPWPPSVNTYWRRGITRGRNPKPVTHISKQGKAYRAEIIARWRRCRPPMTGRLRLEYVLHPPDRRQRDLDNVNKALWDALTHAGVWLDDSQVDDYRVRRGAIVKGGLVRMVIEEIAADATVQGGLELEEAAPF